jgi:hypothetical protein
MADYLYFYSLQLAVQVRQIVTPPPQAEGELL